MSSVSSLISAQSATASTILLLIEVLTAAVLAVFLLNEYLTVVGIFGGAFILLAVILINIKLIVRKSNVKTKE